MLEIKNLVKHFPIRSTGVLRRVIGQVQAVSDVSFTVQEGRSLGLVGESGCGKSTTGKTITRLLDPTSGEVWLDGTNVADLSAKQMLPYRQQIQMIFQDPYSSLNPRQTVGAIVGAPLRIHNMVPKDKTLTRVQELLETVGLNPEHYNRYPLEFSGGQRQRIGVARALAVEPKMIIADEPVSALDVSIQAQVMNLLTDLQKEFGIAFLFIAHDLAVVRHFCADIAVMYLGKIVEVAETEELLGNPLHPYTKALLSAVPVPDPTVTRPEPDISGGISKPVNPPPTCRFLDRCPWAEDVCRQQDHPPLEELRPDHFVSCYVASRHSRERPATAQP